jgi:hypothetical protein
MQPRHRSDRTITSILLSWLLDHFYLLGIVVWPPHYYFFLSNKLGYIITKISTCFFFQNIIMRKV